MFDDVIGRITRQLIVGRNGTITLQQACHLRGDIGPAAAIGAIAGTDNLRLHGHRLCHLITMAVEHYSVLNIINRALQFQPGRILLKNGGLMIGYF